MEREELARLLDTYATALKNREECEKKITELKSRKEITASREYCQFTLIRFYWPFFILFFVIIVIATIVFGIVNNNGFSFSFVLYQLIFALFYFPITALIANALKNKASEKLYNENVGQLNKENEKAEEEIKKYETLLDESYRIIADTKDLVPAKYRTVSSVMAIRRLLIAGKASTVEEAVKFLK
ncbi:MAG: hypothetical protein J5802_04235 [Butyrivibrio sp.]|nr:hypothetical protein [Butyrivibrio sp.]